MKDDTRAMPAYLKPSSRIRPVSDERRRRSFVNDGNQCRVSDSSQCCVSDSSKGCVSAR
jgi:hypothetical protein